MSKGSHGVTESTVGAALRMARSERIERKDNMSHISRIDLTRDFKAHRDEYMKAIEAVCEETAFSGGRFADKFDEEFAPFVGTAYACGLNNGTSALHLAMLALGVGPEMKSLFRPILISLPHGAYPIQGQHRYLWTVPQTPGRSIRTRLKRG